MPDLFLRSLAKDQKGNATCIILAGTGAHGSQGVRENEAQGGLIVAQEPTEAQFPEMRKNAIATGVVDVVCPVERMPRALLDYVRHGVEGESAAARTDGRDETGVFCAPRAAWAFASTASGCCTGASRGA